MTVTTEMDEATERNPDEACPPADSMLYKFVAYEMALKQIAGTEWPVNVYGTSPQKIAREALK